MGANVSAWRNSKWSEGETCSGSRHPCHHPQLLKPFFTEERTREELAEHGRDAAKGVQGRKRSCRPAVAHPSGMMGVDQPFRYIVVTSGFQIAPAFSANELGGIGLPGSGLRRLRWVRTEPGS